MENKDPKKISSPGYLFPVENKKSAKHPDYKGKFTLNGKEYILSGWEKDKDGKKMIAISLTDPADLAQLNNNTQNNNQGNNQNKPQQNYQPRNPPSNSNQEENYNQRPTPQSQPQTRSQPEPEFEPQQSNQRSNNHNNSGNNGSTPEKKNIDPDFGDLFQNL